MANPLTVIARVKAKPGAERRVEEELRKLLTPTRAEDGCINYDMHRSLEDPTLFLFHETWTSEAHLQRHLDSPHIRAWFALSQTLVAEPIEVTRWQRVS